MIVLWAITIALGCSVVSHPGTRMTDIERNVSGGVCMDMHRLFAHPGSCETLQCAA
jgi:hypothetical protein